VAIAVAVFIGWRGRTAHNALGLRYSAGPFAVPMLAALGLALVHPGKDPRFAFAVGLVVDLFNIELGIERWPAMCEAIIQTSCGNELSYHSGQSETPRKAPAPFRIGRAERCGPYRRIRAAMRRACDWRREGPTSPQHSTGCW
jgi:hypothetical protein